MSHHLPVRLWYITVRCDGWCVWTLLEITPLYGRGNQIFFSCFSLRFLYSWRHRIILPILEWLQQRHCYSQGASSPRCNSIHSQLDWPVIYRKSSSSEELWFNTHTHTGNSPWAAHDVFGLRSGQFKAVSISRKRYTVKKINHWESTVKAMQGLFKKPRILFTPRRGILDNQIKKMLICSLGRCHFQYIFMGTDRICCGQCHVYHLLYWLVGLFI